MPIKKKPVRKPVKPLLKPVVKAVAPETDHIVIITDEVKAVDPAFRVYRHKVEPVKPTCAEIRAAARIAKWGREECQP